MDTEKADYAVVTGVQIHNYSTDYHDESPNLEFVAPCSVYVVVRGQRTYLDLNAIPVRLLFWTPAFIPFPTALQLLHVHFNKGRLVLAVRTTTLAKASAIVSY